MHNLDDVEEEAEVVVEYEETDNDYLLEKDKLRRVIKSPQRLGYPNLVAFALISTSEVLNEEPRDYKEAAKSRNTTEKMKATNDELKYFHDNNTWEMIEKPEGSVLVICKWIFKVKKGIEGVMSKHFKVRLVTIWFTQKECIKFNYMLSHIVKHKSI